MKTNIFMAFMTSFAKLMGKEKNHHLLFLWQKLANSFHHELQDDKRGDGGQDSVPLIQFDFLLAGKDLKFIPLNIDLYSSILTREFDEECIALESGMKRSEYRRQREEEIRSKDSFIVKKIFSIPDDWMRHVNKISENTKIPPKSLIKILNVIATDKGSYKVWGGYFRSIDKVSILISEETTPDERDKLVISAWNQLHGLLMECLCLVVMMGTMEFTRLICYIYFNMPDRFSSHLLATAVFYEQEDQIFSITSTDELWQYIYKELNFYYLFFPILHSYIQSFYKTKAYKYYKLIEKSSIKSRIEPQEMSDSIDPMRYTGMLHDELLDKIDRERENRGDYCQDEDSGKDHTSNYKFFDQDYDDPVTDSNDGQSSGEYSESEFENFVRNIGSGGLRKMLYGLLSKYELRGSPYNLMGYIGVALQNVTLTVVEEHYDGILKDEYHISSRTRRRYKQDFESESVYVSATTIDPEGVKFQDLQPEHIDEIKKAKQQRKQHRQEGFFTQRQLINILRSDGFIRTFHKETGMKLKKYSAPTLLKRLQTLIQLNKIDVVRTESAIQYEVTKDNLLKIATEIVNLSGDKR